MDALPSRDDDFSELLERVSALPPARQLELYQHLREFVSRAITPDLPADIEARRRKRALDCLKAVYAYYERDVGEKLTVKEYDAVYQQLELPIGSGGVVVAWRRWSYAQSALRGESVPQTASQKRLLRAEVRPPVRRDDHLEIVRAFLAESPVAATERAYNSWVKDWNRRRSPDTPRATTAPNLFRHYGGLRWSDILAMARGEQLGELSDDAYAEIVGAFEATRLARLTSTEHLGKKSFPAPIAQIRGRRLWLRDDVIAHRDDRGDAPAREPFRLQAELLSSHDLATLLGTAPKTISARVGLRSWHLVPHPVATIRGIGSMWWKADVEKWIGDAAKLSR